MGVVKGKEQLDQAEKPGFDLPDSYFDTLENNILNRIENEDDTKVIKLFSRRNILYASGIAAAILILFNLSIFSESITIDDLETETVENYIINEGIDSYELAVLLSEDDLLEDELMEQNITDESLEDYLLENLDIEELIIE